MKGMMGWTLRDLVECAVVAWAVLSSAALYWLSLRFAPKHQVDKLASKIEGVERRLAEGETRFAHLGDAINRVGEAAKKAESAATKIGGVELQLAELTGAIKALQATVGPIEHFNKVLVEGHMHMGER